MGKLQCRLCGTPLDEMFVDLGMSPPCENFLDEDQANELEAFYPLDVRICPQCLLVQLPEHLPADEIFSDTYGYYSSFSSSWLQHAADYCEMMGERLDLDHSSLITEVASNDGYLLRNFVEAGIPVLGVEPAGNVAAAARETGVRTEEVFLGAETGADLSRQYGKADLVIGNNVFAHVPDLRSFVAGLGKLLAADGTLTLEFPHLLKLIQLRQYDTIYHEHFSYFTLLTAQRALATSNLTVVDVQELPSHGGSLRLFIQHDAHAGAPSDAVAAVLAEEANAGLHTLEGHRGFAPSVDKVKSDLLEFLIQAQRDGKKVVGYGAPGKGNTLLNHCGIRTDYLQFTVDMNHHKHGRYLPGTHIPIHSPDRIAQERPDYVLLLPWNLRKEIAAQLAYIAEWGGKIVVPIPELEIVDVG